MAFSYGLYGRASINNVRSKMTFEEWKKRPVFVAQCKTWKMAGELGVCCVRFRCLPPFRDAQAQRARNRVADVMRAERQRQRAS
ncbi:hypothetical protein AB4Y45_34670 [Paraburkholderia sp. EG287A]|uniref:hypothetical protein n=1 Tax=Paraburkholderia sp. EG287A TaxID=3237012 RepID=UPI0034D18B21